MFKTQEGKNDVIKHYDLFLKKWHHLMRSSIMITEINLNPVSIKESPIFEVTSL